MSKSSKKDSVKTKISSKSAAKPSNVRNIILDALSHPEAEDGLYFRNFFLLHEEDTRPGVKAPKSELLAALNDLLGEGKVKVDFDDIEVTFRLA